jgi:hypothetical protein
MEILDSSEDTWERSPDHGMVWNDETNMIFVNYGSNKVRM